MRNLIRTPFARFLFVGVSNTALTFAIYEALLPLSTYRLAFTLSFIVGLVFTGLLNIKIVFSTSLTATTIASFVVYYCIYYLLNMAALSLTIEAGGVPAAIAPILTLLVLTPINFLCSKFVIVQSHLWARRISHRK